MIKKYIPLICLLCLAMFGIKAQPTVTNIKAEYHNGQAFITWSKVPGYTGFYYVYKYKNAITNSNLSSAVYLGRVPANFTFNYFLNLGTSGGTKGNPLQYVVINNSPTEQLDSTQGLFVSLSQTNATKYYAVTYDVNGNEYTNISPGDNATKTGLAETIAPIQAVEQFSGLPLLGNKNLFYDAWVVFGTNQSTQYTPAMTNEGSLYFNFGIVKNGSGTKNAATMFFYGGGGNAYSSCNAANVPGLWKISMEDAIPNFNWDPVNGEDTKWIGYNENFDVYAANANTPWPTTGTDRTYTLVRAKWTLDWVLSYFGNSIDPTKIAVNGVSNGCAGAMFMSLIYPSSISSCDITNGKLNLDYLYDTNPSCKWNIGGGDRNKENIYLGDYVHDLPTDVNIIGKTSSQYHMYEFGNMNVLENDNNTKKNSLPIIFTTSGKSDIETCWDEKVPFYNTVNTDNSGGFYYWDLRQHKNGSKMDPDRPINQVLRYSTALSYPAFANCTVDGNPGDTNVTTSPYYNGDTVGTHYGNLDWLDTSIHETSTSWQAIIFSKLDTLQNGNTLPFSGLPSTIKTDITLRRLQLFKGMANNTKICMDDYKNGAIIQSKSITYKTSKALMTFKQVQISKNGNLIKVYVCSSPQRDFATNPNDRPVASFDELYPNPTTGESKIEFSLNSAQPVMIYVKDIIGNTVLSLNMGTMNEGDQSIPLHLQNLSNGVYMVEVHAGDLSKTYKLIKD